jgi:uncharacterized protein YtpQ (UPF0354 family)
VLGVSDVRRAIAYLKALEPAVGEAAVVLPPETQPVIHPFSDDLAVSYVLDEGEGLRFVNHGEMASGGVDAEELHRIGVGNLVGVANARGMKVQPYGKIFAILLDGNFEASLIAVDALWDQGLRQLVAGDYAAVVPARDLLAFCDGNDAKGIEELRQMLGRAAGKVDHPLSQRLYFRRGGRWASEMS